MERAAGTGDIDLDAGDAAIGVDVGGTKMAIGLIDAATLTLVAKTVIATGRERGGEAILRDVEEHVRSLNGHARALGLRVAGVGVVVPENVSVAESPASKKDVFAHSHDSRGAQDYEALLNELVDSGFIEARN